MLHATTALRQSESADIEWTSADAPALDRLAQHKATARQLAVHCNAYRGPILSRALWQIATTILPFIAVVAGMLATIDTYPWLTMALAIPGGGLLVRCFIIQHDCGHGSFFGSRRLNTATGRLLSVLTLTPYDLWRREHAQHHASSGNLDRRGVGDINTLTIREYLALGRLQKLNYAIYRHPLFLFGFGVPFYFLIIQRLPWGHPYSARETWKSVMALNLAIVALYGPLGWVIGFDKLALIVWPMLHIASAVGGWLFFVQHQFEETHWEDEGDWSFQVTALHGSSYYQLPPLLNWFTGNIGLHHIHHLNSMIPNYRLGECLAASPELKSLNRLSLWESFSCARLKLWDEDARRLVGFEALTRAQAN